jgi:hypothetical protein
MIAKLRGIMHRVCKVSILHEHITKNPVLHVESRSRSTYRGIPSCARITALRERVFIGVLRNNLRDVQDVEDFSAKRALASPGPCVAAYRARLVLDLS